MSKGKKILLFIMIFIIVFLGIFAMAQSYAKIDYPDTIIINGRVMPEAPTGGQCYELVNRFFYFRNERICRIFSEPPIWYPYIFWWLFLSLIISIIITYAVILITKKIRKK